MIGRLRMVVGSGFASSPPLMIVLLLVATAGALSQVGIAYGLSSFVDSALSGDRTGVIASCVLIAALLSFVVCGATFESALTHRMTDLVRLHLTARMLMACNTRPGVEHFEHDESRRELDLLQDSRRSLGNGPREAVRIYRVLVRLAGMVFLLGRVHPVLVLLPIFGAAPFASESVASSLERRNDQELVDDKRRANELFDLATTSAPGKELRVFGWGPELLGRHRSLAAAVTRSTERAALLGSVISTSGWLVFAIGYLAAVGITLTDAIAGQSTIGEVLLVATLGRQARGYLGEFVGASTEMSKALDGAARLRKFERATAQVSAHAGGADVPDRLEGGIALEGVSFRYPGLDRVVLSDVDLRLAAGTTVAIVGENGAGKSTLVKLLTGMYVPTTGRIVVDSDDLSSFDVDAWRARCTASLQQFVCFEVAAGQVVTLGDLPRLDDLEGAVAALERAGAGDVSNAFGGDFSTPLGRSQGGRDLSQGQWQKLALGRGLMRDAPLLAVFDEPTASLDPMAERALFDRFADNARRLGDVSGAITLLISHRFSSVRSADTIVVLDGGRVIESGTHDELQALGGMYAELFQMQAKGYG